MDKGAFSEMLSSSDGVVGGVDCKREKCARIDMAE